MISSLNTTICFVSTLQRLDKLEAKGYLRISHLFACSSDQKAVDWKLPSIIQSNVYLRERQRTPQRLYFKMEI
ncbi:hypothetical protein Taro_043788 [Colocasia esculenta]|uniref:Uncharacterized protein n=1 Tax=Colocasia esculenta TaxID=4460 RepID=A0A843WWM7_COLES|nr:hypothetical protein [Colocasia esculenta]